MKKIISTSSAPAAVGPYSQAIEINNVLYVSGQIALDPEPGTMIAGDVRAQAEQVLKNIGAILEAAGYDYRQVVKSTVLLKDIADFKAVNEVYATFYPTDPPARAAYAVKDLPLGALVEIETIAAK